MIIIKGKLSKKLRFSSRKFNIPCQSNVLTFCKLHKLFADVPALLRIRIPVAVERVKSERLLHVLQCLETQFSSWTLAMHRANT